jgi:hypothetical protein
MITGNQLRDKIIESITTLEQRGLRVETIFMGYNWKELLLKNGTLTQYNFFGAKIEIIEKENLIVLQTENFYNLNTTLKSEAVCNKCLEKSELVLLCHSHSLNGSFSTIDCVEKECPYKLEHIIETQGKQCNSFEHIELQYNENVCRFYKRKVVI